MMHAIIPFPLQVFHRSSSFLPTFMPQISSWSQCVNVCSGFDHILVQICLTESKYEKLINILWECVFRSLKIPFARKYFTLQTPIVGVILTKYLNSTKPFVF